jgi:uncharacterized protein YjiS (DUF1127 family)
MQSTFILQTLSAWLGRQLCQWREAQRLRRELAQLAAMSAHELADIGLTHADVAFAGASTRCN